MLKNLIRKKRDEHSDSIEELCVRLLLTGTDDVKSAISFSVDKSLSSDAVETLSCVMDMPVSRVKSSIIKVANEDEELMSNLESVRSAGLYIRSLKSDFIMKENKQDDPVWKQSGSEPFEKLSREEMFPSMAASAPRSQSQRGTSKTEVISLADGAGVRQKDSKLYGIRLAEIIVDRSLSALDSANSQVLRRLVPRGHCVYYLLTKQCDGNGCTLRHDRWMAELYSESIRNAKDHMIETGVRNSHITSASRFVEFLRIDSESAVSRCFRS